MKTERTLEEVKIWNNMKKGEELLNKYNIPYINENGQRLVFTIAQNMFDAEKEYTYQAHLNRVYYGINDTGLTLLKFLKNKLPLNQ